MHPKRAFAVAAFLLMPLALAGCTTEDTSRAPPEIIQAVADTRPMAWDKGNWWAYDATFHQDKTYAIALVVHKGDASGFRLGSNISSGFFGLPFSGNVTPELNPEIGGKVWPMFQFPLSDGKSWEYHLFGYDATTTAYAAIVDVPGVGPQPGFRLEASSYGQVFAKYDYAPSVGWFTRLELIEPTDRKQVLDVRLKDFGVTYGQGYFVETVIKRVHVEYPTAVPGDISLTIPQGFVRAHVSLSAEATAGAIDARVEDQSGRVMMEARAVAKGLVSDRATIDGGTMRWTLKHAGSGVSSLHLEITGVRAAGATTARYQEGPGPIAFEEVLFGLSPAA